MKIKTSLFIDRNIWREIKKAAIDAGQTVGDFVTGIFTRWKEGRLSVDGHATDSSGGAGNRPD